MVKDLTGPRAQQVWERPGTFALAVIKQFRANQGLLLAGAVAYYTLLSLVPLLILIMLALSHLVDEERLLVTLRSSLEFVVPGQADALVQELRNFFAHRDVIGGVLFVTMLFFSALAFTVLENAMSVTTCDAISAGWLLTATPWVKSALNSGVFALAPAGSARGGLNNSCILRKKGYEWQFTNAIGVKLAKKATSVQT